MAGVTAYTVDPPAPATSAPKAGSRARPQLAFDEEQPGEPVTPSNTSSAASAPAAGHTGAPAPSSSSKDRRHHSHKQPPHTEQNTSTSSSASSPFAANSSGSLSGSFAGGRGSGTPYSAASIPEPAIMEGLQRDSYDVSAVPSVPEMSIRQSPGALVAQYDA
jgi:hypothetical protein